MTVAEFKTRFSEVLEEVRHGESIAVTYGRSKKTVAIIQPPARKRKKGRSLGMLKGKASFEIQPNFEMNEAEFLKS
jgi:prevent-host-death family protein